MVVSERDNGGRFIPGKSGNPGGRPAMPKEIKSYLSRHTMKAARKLVELIDHGDPGIAFKASTAVLERVYGKPDQANKLENTAQGQIVIVMKDGAAADG